MTGVSAPDLIVCGSLTIDNVLTADGEARPPVCGGNVMYAALGARVWAPRVGAVARAGANYPADGLDGLAARGIDLGGVTRGPALHGMNVAFRYRADGSRERVFPPAVMARLPAAERTRFVDYTTRGMAQRFATWLAFTPDAGDLPVGWIAAARGVHLAAMPVERHLAIAGSLRRARPDLTITVDSPWYDERDLARDHHAALFGLIDALLPSEADLATFRPGEQPLETARALARGAACTIVVKQGAAGCTVLGRDGSIAAIVPRYPVQVVDLTGAGDAFCGGFLAGLIAGRDLAGAAVAGTVAASFAIERVGTAGLYDLEPAEAARRFDHVAARVQRFRASGGGMP